MTAWLAPVLMVAFLLAGGCSHEDFSHVSVTSPITDVYQAGKPYVQGNSDAEAAARARRLARVLAQRQPEPGSLRDYHVGPDDVLEIGILALEEPNKVSKVQLAVQSDGAINIPWIGLVPVGGLTLRDVETRIKTSIEGRFIKNPQVTAAVVLFRSAPIVITGAVHKPGVYYLHSDTSTILELLVEADGLSADAGSQMLVIRNSGSNTVVIASAVAQAAQKAPTNSATAATGRTNAPATGVDVVAVPTELMLTNSDQAVLIDLKQLIDDGDLRLNVRVRGGDIMNIPPKAREYFYVLGYVNRPGAYEVDRNKPLAVLQAVAVAGGLNGSARAENTCLLRPATNGLQVIAVDLTTIARGVRPSFDMAPGDTLVVGSSLMARLGEFVHPAVGASVNAAKDYSP